MPSEKKMSSSCVSAAASQGMVMNCVMRPVCAGWRVNEVLEKSAKSAPSPEVAIVYVAASAPELKMERFRVCVVQGSNESEVSPNASKLALTLTRDKSKRKNKGSLFMARV